MAAKAMFAGLVVVGLCLLGLIVGGVGYSTQGIARLIVPSHQAGIPEQLVGYSAILCGLALLAGAWHCLAGPRRP